jgi:hypothetical protein
MSLILISVLSVAEASPNSGERRPADFWRVRHSRGLTHLPAPSWCRRRPMAVATAGRPAGDRRRRPRTSSHSGHAGQVDGAPGLVLLAFGHAFHAWLSIALSV